MRIPSSGSIVNRGPQKPPPADQREAALALSARLPALLLLADRVAATVAPGIHGRRRAGRGDAFWQFRPYQAGDAIARIDWRQTARGDRTFIRENEWESAQSLWLWADLSASMAWQSNKAYPQKMDRAALLLLALANLLLRGGERVGLLGDGRPASFGRAVMSSLASALPSLPQGEQGLPVPVKLPRHGRIVLFADFLAPLDQVKARLFALAAQGVDGHLVQILDPAEEDLPFDGRVQFEGLENETGTLINRVEGVREAYRDRLAAHRAGLAAIARDFGWGFATHRTDHPPQTALLALYAHLSGQGRRSDPAARSAQSLPDGGGQHA